MKLVIEIPEKAYNHIKNKEECTYAELFIAHGTPYNPKEDCISREALKKILSEPLYRSTIKDYGEVLKYTFVTDVIDNAPTIPLPILNEQIAWEQGYEAGLAQGKHDRPKGEWLKYLYYAHDNRWECICSKCGKLDRQEDNFCPNCGADMRKGGKE